ncbi:MAG: amino acid permease [Mycoplasmoidaceae bacterium]|nr:amino acid permease [Mycoplasmoidaceae bacterium]
MTVNAIFFSETIFNFINAKGGDQTTFSVHMGIVIAVAIGGIAIFSLVNIFFANAMKKVSSVTTILKFIPLALIIFAGIIYGCFVKTDYNLFTQYGKAGVVPIDFPIKDNTKYYSGSFNFTGILDSLPAILFAFDSFLIVGNIAGEMKKPERNVPLSIVLSMATAGVVYLLVTIGQVCVGRGSAYAVFDYIFAADNKAGARIAFHVIISVFIFIAIFGVMNSFAMGSLRSFDDAVEQEVVVGSK